jgi:hypothetical protein
MGPSALSGDSGRGGLPPPTPPPPATTFICLSPAPLGVDGSIRLSLSLSLYIYIYILYDFMYMYTYYMRHQERMGPSARSDVSIVGSVPDGEKMGKTGWGNVSGDGRPGAAPLMGPEFADH